MRSKKRNGILAILVVTLLLCGAGAAVWKYENSGERLIEREAAQQESLYQRIAPELPEEASDASSSQETPGTDSVGNLLEEAQAESSDLVGWITVPDTTIDYPIVQTDDNSFYLNHGFEKQSSSLGVPFLDYRNASDFSDFNSIVYGHNMDKDRMFRCVNYFLEQDYFDAHPTGTLTLPDCVYTVEFFCCARVDSDSELYQQICVTNPQKTAFLETLSEHAVCAKEFDTQALLEERLLVLSTCTYAEGDARTVLVGQLQEN